MRKIYLISLFMFVHGITSFIFSENKTKLDIIHRIIQQNYVDSLPPSYVKSLDIDSLGNSLDPYSFYCDPQYLATLESSLLKPQLGIGISSISYNDSLLIDRVYPNTAAAKSGLRIGDRILKLNGCKISGKQDAIHAMSAALSRSKSLLIFELMRIDGMGRKSFLTYKVKRSSFCVNPVLVNYRVHDAIGYLKIGLFSKDTEKIVKKKISCYVRLGMKALIIDLRDNPGGYSDESIRLASDFLPKNSLIVSLRGAHLKTHVYYSRGECCKGLRLILLVNHATASSAEIFAGTLQDWDRAIIVGQPSFGKGLVQRQFIFNDKSLLSLSIARYYTPSGRCLQKYSSSTRIFKKTTGQSFFSKMKHRSLAPYRGIIPDCIVNHSDSLQSIKEQFIRSGILFHIACMNYSLLYRSASYSKYLTAPDFISNYIVSESDLNQAKKEALALKILLNKATWISIRIFVAHQIKGEMIRLLYGDTDYYKFLNQTDSVFQYALQLVPSYNHP